MAQAGFALLLANLRYWTSVAPLVRVQLAKWEERARAIPDPMLRELAIGKLVEERFNVEVAATLATLAKPPRRREVVEAIVALQVAYDYVDSLTEQPPTHPPAEERSPLDALLDAFRPGEQRDAGLHDDNPRSGDGGYLAELVGAIKGALGQLPAENAIGEAALRSATRFAEAQRLSHAAARVGTGELETWARRKAADTDLEWPEFLAGAAASVLAIHSLIAAAADERTTSLDAEQIDAAYLSICALTMLDSLVDREHDIEAGELSYLDFYESREQMGMRLARVTRDARCKARKLPQAGHHVVTLAGVVAYYTSALNAEDTSGRVVTAPICDELRPIVTPTLAVMWTWRRAKAVRNRRS